MDILNFLFEATVYSGVIFTAIMLLKTFLRDKMSPHLHYAIWFVLVLRLLLPVTIASPVHFFVIPAEQQNQAALEPVQPDGSTPVSSPEINTADTAVTQPDAEAAEPVHNEIPAAPAAANVHYSLTLPQIAALAWLAGAGVCLSNLALLHASLRRKLRKNAAPPSKRLTALFNEAKAELGVKANIKLVCQYEYGTPALMFPKTIMMPLDALVAMDDEQTMFALRHELMHYRRGDHIVSILLSLLSAFYWFNPFVWIAFFQMRKDMETACDGKVVKKLDAEAKRRYASLILRLSAQPAHRQLVLGMSRSGLRKAAERRVKSIFMKGESKMNVKLITLLMAAALLFTCFTTACQPTPEKPVVIKKGDDLSGLILSTSDISPEETVDNTALYASLGVPEHLNLQTQTLDGKLNIAADVDIKLPNVSRFPVASAVLRPFSQEEIEKVVGVVLGDRLKFTEVIDFTQESLQQLILEIKQNIAMQKSGQEPDAGVLYNEDDLAYYQGLLADALNEGELAEKDLTIETLNGYGTYQGIHVSTEADGQRYIIRAGSPITPDAVYNISISTGTSPYGTHFDGVYEDAPYGVSLSKEEAAQQAKAIAAQLTDELSLCYVAPTATFKKETDRNWGWACVFMREINGCPTAYATEDIGSSMESELQKPIRYEKMVIVIDDLGVTGFDWENPMKIISIDNDSVTLMPFDEIQQRAIVGLGDRLRYDSGRDPDCTAYITKVELGLMRVMKANSNEYYYLPVWNFFSKIEHTEAYKDKHNLVQGGPKSVDENGSLLLLVTGYPKAWGSVTINALDGSIINKDLGY